jgi:hypothetical protein
MKAANEGATYVLPVSDEDLRLYAAGRLTADRRRQIEGLLACNPDLAAQVMAQMHRLQLPPAEPNRRSMRLALASLFTAVGIGLGVGAAIIAQPARSAGWREADGDEPPVYVTEAAESREAALARAQMISQSETPLLDAEEVGRILKVRLPTLPAGWRVVDAQVFPTDFGPSINLVLETAELKRLDLFAVRASTLTGERPEIASRRGETVAFWEEGQSAYVLSGAAKPEELLRQATALKQRASL